MASRDALGILRAALDAVAEVEAAWVRDWDAMAPATQRFGWASLERRPRALDAFAVLRRNLRQDGASPRDEGWFLLEVVGAVGASRPPASVTGRCLGGRDGASPRAASPRAGPATRLRPSTPPVSGAQPWTK